MTRTGRTWLLIGLVVSMAWTGCTFDPDYVPSGCELAMGASGITLIDPDGRLGSGEPFEVYCELDTLPEGGGWTLVGRSGDGDVDQGGGFGWLEATGSLADDSRPYSLGVSRIGEAFDTVLFGARNNSGKAWEGSVYKVHVPADFIEAYRTTPFTVTEFFVMQGDCYGEPDKVGPSMLEYMGYTEESDLFYFRDHTDYSRPYGLVYYGWATAYEDCAMGANLQNRHGMIFVRNEGR